MRIRDTGLEGYDNICNLPEEDLIMIGESDKDIGDYIADFDPDVVGISSLFSNLMEHTHTIAKIAKTVNNNITVVLGGNPY